MNDPLKKYIDNNREAFDNKEPSDELWNKIKKNIPKQNEDEVTKVIEIKKKWSISDWSIAASVLLVIGIGTYFLLNNSKVNSLEPEINIVKDVSEEVPKSLENEKDFSTFEQLESIKKEHEEIIVHHKIEEKESSKTFKEKIVENEDISLRAELMEKLNDQESTSNRIDAIARLGNLESLTHEESNLLKEMIKSDPNTIVRLNAIEVLANKFPKQNVSNELTQIFMQQDDPMVQMELINVIAKLNNNTFDSKLIQKLQEMVLDPRTMPFVKDEAYAVLLRK